MTSGNFFSLTISEKGKIIQLKKEGKVPVEELTQRIRREKLSSEIN